MVGSDGIDVQQVDVEGRQLPPDSPWRQRIREQAGTLPRQHREIASKIPDRATKIEASLKKWTRGGFWWPPTIPSILEVARIIDYPVVEQLIDLGYLSLEDLEVIDSPLLTPGWLLIQRLELALSENRKVSSGVADLVLGLRSNTLQTASNAPHDLARWRAKLFDVPVGSVYPHIGYHAVEFEVWLGPTFGDSAHARLMERARLGREALERLVPSPGEREARIRRHVNQRKPTVDVLAGANERAELEERIQVPRANGHFNVYGLEGSLGAPLVGSSSSDTEPRHIYVESASSRTDVKESRPLAPDTDLFTFAGESGESRSSSKVLLIAPPAASPLPLAHLIGRALGWEVVSLRQSAGNASGSLVRIRDQVAEARVPLDRAGRSFRTASRPSILVTSYLKHLAETAEGKRMLLDDTVVPILLKPTKATLESWAARQSIGQRVLTTAPVEGTENLLDQIEVLLQERAKGHYEILEFRNDMQWWPRRKDLPGEFAPRTDYFEHPSIGDIRLRAAYQLAYLFVRGKLANSRNAHTYFLSGPVARFHDRLLSDPSRPLRVPRRRKRS